MTDYATTENAGLIPAPQQWLTTQEYAIIERAVRIACIEWEHYVYGQRDARPAEAMSAVMARVQLLLDVVDAAARLRAYIDRPADRIMPSEDTAVFTDFDCAMEALRE